MCNHVAFFLSYLLPKTACRLNTIYEYTDSDGGNFITDLKNNYSE